MLVTKNGRESTLFTSPPLTEMWVGPRIIVGEIALLTSTIYNLYVGRWKIERLELLFITTDDCLSSQLHGGSEDKTLSESFHPPEPPPHSNLPVQVKISPDSQATDRHNSLRYKHFGN